VADDNPYPQRTHPGDPRPSDAASESGQGAGAGPSAPSGADGRGQADKPSMLPAITTLVAGTTLNT